MRGRLQRSPQGQQLLGSTRLGTPQARARGDLGPGNSQRQRETKVAAHKSTLCAGCIPRALLGRTVQGADDGVQKKAMCLQHPLCEYCCDAQRPAADQCNACRPGCRHAVMPVVMPVVHHHNHRGSLQPAAPVVFLSVVCCVRSLPTASFPLPAAVCSARGVCSTVVHARGRKGVYCMAVRAAVSWSDLVWCNLCITE